MKIIAISDLHWPENKEKIGYLAKKINSSNADVLAIPGTDCDSTKWITEILGLLNPFKGDKLYTPGNHDLLLNRINCTKEAGEDIIYNEFFKRFSVDLKESIEKLNFQYLINKPFIKENVGFVGTIDFENKTTPREIRFSNFCQKKLEEQIESITPYVDRITLISHFIPPMDIIKKYGKIKDVIYGHIHNNGKIKVDGINYYNVAFNSNKLEPSIMEI